MSSQWARPLLVHSLDQLLQLTITYCTASNWTNLWFQLRQYPLTVTALVDLFKFTFFSLCRHSSLRVKVTEKRLCIFTVYIVTCFLTLHGVQTQPFLNTVSCVSPQTLNRAFKALISILIITCLFITASAQLSLSFLVSGPHHQNRLISEVFWHWHTGGRLIWTFTFTSIFLFFISTQHFNLPPLCNTPLLFATRPSLGLRQHHIKKVCVYPSKPLDINWGKLRREWGDCLGVVWSCCPITDGRMALHCLIITSDH